MTKPILVLLDSNNTLYRMFHSIPPIERGGQRVESAHGVINSVNSLLKMSPLGVPTKLIVCSDAPGDNFRHRLSPHYKSERKGMPEELAEQEWLVKDALAAMGIANIEKDDIEADDTLGMIANMYVERGYRVVIVTNDKDMMQLVNDDISLHNPITKKLVTAKEVEDKFGVKPERIADLLALMGDKADGIIGLDGVGEKTAARWLNSFGSLEQLAIRCNEVKGKAGDQLRAYHPEILDNLALTTIRSCPSHLTDVEVALMDNIKPDQAKCFSLSAKYGLELSPVTHIKVERVKEKEPEPMQHGLF